MSLNGLYQDLSKFRAVHVGYGTMEIYYEDKLLSIIYDWFDSDESKCLKWWLNKMEHHMKVS